MRSFTLFTMGFLVIINVGHAGNDAVKAELEKLQGTWQLVSAESDGKKTDDDVVKKIQVIIKGNKHTVRFEDKVLAKEIPFMIDPSKKPKTTDDQLPDGSKILGI